MLQNGIFLSSSYKVISVKSLTVFYLLFKEDDWKKEYVPVPVPVPVYVPVPMHMYSQNVPVPTAVPVPVSQT